ncbi:YfbK domain-containing protein [Haloferula rosea]|uniref:von Willebrand factor type A domain-containing protein n=1 Tax=Haloferula rosea TaxID=490093 RepID=A0A934VDF0_9BACT|nr:von Willebrand factor type A domain-containing protein [Haloferula rosea]MBK1826204.1 von Willebrand factor type A domain-containing protein [Haloferula rosea]
MKNDSDQPLTSVEDDAFEARLVAWVLGEASAFEQAELETLYRSDREVALFVDRLRLLDGLIKEEGEEVWRLSDERRAKVLALMGDKPPVVVRRINRQWWSVAAAAVVMVVAIGGALSTMGVRRSVKSEKSAPVIVSYSAPAASPSAASADSREFAFLSEYEPPELPNGLANASHAIDEEVQERALAVNESNRKLPNAIGGGFPVTPATPTDFDADAWGGSTSRSGADELGLEQLADSAQSAESQGEVIAGHLGDRNSVLRSEIPAKLSSSMAKVIGSNSASPAEIPVPETTVPDPSTSFGDGDDFGVGWGGAIGGGSGGGGFTGHIEPTEPSGVPTVGDLPGVGSLFQRAGEVADSPEEPTSDPFAAAPPRLEAPVEEESFGRSVVDAKERTSGAVAGGAKAEAQNIDAIGGNDGNGFGGIDGSAVVTGGMNRDLSALEGRPAGSTGDGLENRHRFGMDIDGRVSGWDSRSKQSGLPNEALAEREALQRQDGLSESDRLLREARNSYSEGEYDEALDLYAEGLERLPDTPAAESRRLFFNDSLADAEIAVAEEAIRVGQYDKAKDLLKDAAGRASDSRLAEQKLEDLTDPIRTSPALSEEHNRKVDDVRRGLYQGEGHYNLGQYDEAQKQYEGVLKTDPENRAARRGMERIAAAKESYYKAAYDETRAELLSEVDSAWEMQSEVGDSSGSSGLKPSVTSTLNSIIIPEVDFKDVSLEEAVDFLRAKAVEGDVNELDPAKKGLGLRVEMPRQAWFNDGLDAGANDPGGQVRIPELRLRNVPLGEALNYVAEATRMRWKVEDDGIVIQPATEVGEDLFTRTYRVSPDFASRLMPDQGSEMDEDPFASSDDEQPLMPDQGSEMDEDPFASSDDEQPLMTRMSMEDLLRFNGVRFAPEAQAQFFPENSTLLVRNTPSNLDLVEQLVKELASEASAEAPLTRMEEVSASDDPYSTFSLHVSDSSFKLAAAAMERGEIPDAEGIRPEEFYNAFDYGDPSPAVNEPVACVVEQSAHPAFPQRNLMRVAVRTGSAGRAQTTPLNLTLLLDNSGSMEREDRAEGVGQAVEQLASLLQPGDKVTVAGFSRQPRLLVDRLDGGQAEQLNGLVAQLPSEGGTNLEEALVLGEELAKRQYVEGAQNRVVLFTDGAANLGDADPDSLNGRVEALRQNGISFDAAGFGADGLNDRLLERLTRNGNGRYYVVDDAVEAGEGFADKLAGAFRPQAENVKVQIVFNPARVGNYKLIGFEKHRLKKEDFRNDAVDAAEMASEEAGVALYQFEVLPEGEGEIGEVSVRFRDVGSGEMVERTWTIPYDPSAPAFDQAAESLQLAALAAFAAEKLRSAPMSEVVDLAKLSPVLARVAARYPEAPRIEQLRRMIEQLR